MLFLQATNIILTIVNTNIFNVYIEDRILFYLQDETDLSEEDDEKQQEIDRLKKQNEHLLQLNASLQEKIKIYEQKINEIKNIVLKS